MVDALVRGLPLRGIEVVHVQMRLSPTSSDIGRWRPGKVYTAVRAAMEARRIARSEKCDALYYVPAPAKRGALFRDLVVMGLCRTSVEKLVLHWHAPGLGAWLSGGATSPERILSMRALGGADLAIVLAPELEHDAKALAPQRTAVVPNGIVDSGPYPRHVPGAPTEILFLGLGSREKGLRDTVDAVAILNGRRPGSFRLTFAGSFPEDGEQEYFARRQAELGGSIRHVGFADEAQKRELFSSTDIFCLPTYYPNEGQPLAIIEALAHDLRIVTTRWRAIPSMLPPENVWFAEPRQPQGLADTIERAADAPPANGAMRRHFLTHFTLEAHLAALERALRLIACK
jgi:glycosyltransferase involved in cell wall biosynthesis